MILPSYYREGVPHSLIEALAMGLPIITTDTPGCQETVDDGKNGYLVPPKNSTDLNYAMNILAKDKKFNLHGIEGTIYYKNKIKDCYKKMDEIDLELSEVFKNAKKLDKDTYKHSYDKSGESTITDISFQLNDGIVILACYDWSEKQPWDDHLRISVRTKVYNIFLREEAY